MKLTAGSASLIGMSFLTATLKGITVEVNQVTNPLNPLGGYGALDFTQGGTVSGFQVATGSLTNPTVTLDYSDEILLASVAQADLQISQFITVIGSLAFEQGPGDQAMNTASGSTVYVDSMTIGASSVYAFVGFGGPYWSVNPTTGMVTAPTNSSAVGLAISNVNLGIAFFSQNIIDGVHDTHLLEENSSYFALKLTAGSASLVGMSFLTATLNGITVEVNQVSNSLNPAGGYKALDFAATFPAQAASGGNPAVPAGMEITTGGTPVYLDYTDEILLASVAEADIQISQFITVIGSFAFEQGPSDQTMKTADGSTVYVDSMTIGAANVYAFVGFGGPYWQIDSSGNVTAPSTTR